jgi:putative ABC transport system permease protein
MTTLLAANLVRRPGRTLLTALGTAVGVATIVALLGVTSGIQNSAGELVHLGAADLGVFQAGAGDPTASVLPTSLVPRVERQPGIARATPLQLLVEPIPKVPSAIVFGAETNGFFMRRLVIVRGRLPHAPDEAVVGDALASQLHVSVGSPLRISRRPFRVSGIYHFGAAFQDGGAVIPLATAQRIAGRTGEVTTIAVQLQPDVRPKQAEATLRRALPGVEVIADAQEAARAGANGQLISNAVTVIVVLALLVGGIGVANTMLMAILERRAEFALMSAVGWSSPQIAGVVLAEGVGVSLIGAAIGLLFGVVGANLLVHALGAAVFVSPDVTAWDLGRGLIIGLGIGVLGGLYPAWRVTRLPPAPALARR